MNFSEKKNAIKWSKSRILKRFDGEIGVDMDYSIKSAFKKNNLSYTKKLTEIENNKKTKMLICSTCFYDNPHCYGKMMFTDFYEVLKFLGKISHEVDYDWYIKPHPDYLPGTLENLRKCLKFFKNCKIIDPETSFHELKNVIDCAVTTYGSIGHELPLLGIPVINCSDIHPHMSFKFNYSPKSKSELTEIIKNKKFQIKDKEDIYSFYYIHYNFLNNSNLFDKNLISFSNNNFNLFSQKLKFLNDNIVIKDLEKKIICFLENDYFKTVDKSNLDILHQINDINFK